MTMQRRSDDINDVSNNVSFYALVCLTIIFLIIVTYGWSTMLVPVISVPSDWSDLLAPFFVLFRYLAAFGIASIGVVLGKGVAAERMRIASESVPKYTNTWKAYFAVLLVISALGTMNTLFMQTQQSGVLGDSISKTRNDLLLLKSKIEEKLATPEFDSRRNEIDQLFANFEKELKNPANCGFGAQSMKQFQKIQILLPKLEPLSLGSGACKNVDALIAGYRDTVSQLRDNSADAKTKKLLENRISMAASIDQTIEHIEEMKSKMQSLDKGVALPVLTSAWNTYAEILKNAELLSGSSFGLPSEIDDKNIQGMGQITQIFPLLISQFDNPVTYVIILAAVIFDILLIEFFARHLHASVVIREESIYSSRSGMKSGRTDNIFEK